MRDKYHSLGMWAEYRFWRNRTKYIIDTSKQQYYNDMIKDSKDSKTLWKCIHSLNPSNPSKPHELITTGDHKTTDHKEIANTFNNYFTSCVEKLRHNRIKNYCIGLEAERNQLQLAMNALKESNKIIYQTSLLEKDSINEQIKKEAAIEMEKSMIQIKEIQLKKRPAKNLQRENKEKWQKAQKKAPKKKDDKGTKKVKIARLARITPTDGKSWKRN
ncbi:unnamed protein product [Mytilus edulis]|uniref:Uncharacterized protein n=1 Tax=Mytilus edulis TaxID=6550 RepID=A0A8S3SWU2_MYTED|nr:unnamed protein product [Mytilus edulis]